MSVSCVARAVGGVPAEKTGRGSKVEVSFLLLTRSTRLNERKNVRVVRIGGLIPGRPARDFLRLLAISFSNRWSFVAKQNHEGPAVLVSRRRPGGDDVSPRLGSTRSRRQIARIQRRRRRYLPAAPDGGAHQQTSAAVQCCESQLCWRLLGSGRQDTNAERTLSKDKWQLRVRK